MVKQQGASSCKTWCSWKSVVAVCSAIACIYATVSFADVASGEKSLPQLEISTANSLVSAAPSVDVSASHFGSPGDVEQQAYKSMSTAAAAPKKPLPSGPYAEREKASLRLSEIYSLELLDCPLASGSLPGGTSHLAFFVYDKLRSTSRVRADMMAAAVTALAGWTAFSLSERSGLHQFGHMVPDLCVCVKYFKYAAEFCRKHKAKVVYWDLLDHAAMPSLLLGSVLDSRVDVVLTPTKQLADIVSRHNPPRDTGPIAGHPRALALYHQHTNPGFLAPLSRMELPFICRVAILRDSKGHGPSTGWSKNIGRQVCRVPGVWSFSMLKVNETEASLQDMVCKGRSKSMAEACSDADAAARQHSRTVGAQMAAKAGCFSEQVEYHAFPELHLVDVIMLLPEWHPEQEQLQNNISKHRPSTRFLHFASHGVPSVAWPFEAYKDLMEEGDYTLPSHRLPFIGGDAGGKLVPDVIKELVPSAARMTLRERGLALAGKYSTLGVARELVRAHVAMTSQQ